MTAGQEQVSMPFLDHLEEFRWRLIKSILSVLLGAIITFAFVDQIIALLILPSTQIDKPFELQVLRVQGMFMVKWGLAIAGGVILAIPVLTYQMWAFVSPGLHSREKKFGIPLIIFTFLSFLTGVLFAYFVIIPFSLNFFTSMGYGDVQNNFSINYYFSFITWLMIGSGLIFELPVLSFMLSVIGFVNPRMMRHYRRYAIIFIMILSAFITPPDPVSLIIMMIPLIVLYEISIGVSWIAVRNKEKS